MMNFLIQVALFITSGEMVLHLYLLFDIGFTFAIDVCHFLTQPTAFYSSTHKQIHQQQQPRIKPSAGKLNVDICGSFSAVNLSISRRARFRIPVRSSISDDSSRMICCISIRSIVGSRSENTTSLCHKCL